MLKYRAPGDFPGGRYPDPLTALGVPAASGSRSRRSTICRCGCATAPGVSSWPTRWAICATAIPATPRSTRKPRGARERGGSIRARSVRPVRDDPDGHGAVVPGERRVLSATAPTSTSDAAYEDWRQRRGDPSGQSRAPAGHGAGARPRGGRQPGSRRAPRCCGSSPRALPRSATTLAEPDMHRLIARQAVLGDPADLQRR